MWWFLDIRTYLPVLCAVLFITLTSLGTCYYPVLIPVPFSCVRPREAIWVGTQRELQSFVPADGDIKAGGKVLSVGKQQEENIFPATL